MKKLFFFLLICSVTFTGYSQEVFQNWEYWNTWTYKPKSDMVDKFEDAAAKKTKKFNASNDNLIVTYKIVTGQDFGTYLRIQPFQKSKDYDKDRSNELKYWSENVIP